MSAHCRRSRERQRGRQRSRDLSPTTGDEIAEAVHPRRGVHGGRNGGDRPAMAGEQKRGRRPLLSRRQRDGYLWEPASDRTGDRPVGAQHVVLLLPALLRLLADE